MKIFRIENVILIGTVALYIGMQVYSLRKNDIRMERLERCFTQAKEDTTALDICSRISSAADGAVRSAQFSIYPFIVVLLGILALIAVKTRRLETEIKELKEKPDA